jgi:hypothetical protein
MARPAKVPVITGAASTIAVAAGAFGLHLAPAALATGVTVLSAVLALVFRQNITPVATLNAAKKPAHAEPAVM